MKKLLKFLVVLIVLLLIIGAAGLILLINLNKSPENMPEEVVFRVNKGDTAYTIGQNLEHEGVIKNSPFFRYYSRFRNTAGSMKSGLYKIQYGLTTMEVHDILIDGSEELFKVTIPPGLSSGGIAAILEKNDIVSANEFLAEVQKSGAEGMLLPDTYFFPKEYPAENTVSFMITNFYDILEDVYPDYESLTEDELKKKIILASIVEREYRVESEAAAIASVFLNRIEENMYLGSCATVVYVITEEQGKEHPERLFYRDLEIESPFNTYINKGLPPAPICNPGKTAIDAAFNPEDTDYLYFLLDDPEKGTHYFSKNLAEHNRSYELYIKGK